MVGHGIVTAFTTGVAAENSGGAQNQAFAGAVAENRVARIVRAGWIKATLRSKNRTQHQLIETNYAQQYPLREICGLFCLRCC